MTDPYDFLWNHYFEQEEQSENINGYYEKELEAKEKYYEKKYPTKSNHNDLPQN